MPSKATPTCYAPLPNNKTHFRLLEILPGEPQDPVRCRLRTEEISSPHPYEAISYIWRVFHDDRDRATIYCCGDDGQHAIAITANLEAALRAIRRRDDVRIVWADAACINQADLTERTEQVQCMRDVYLKAARVLVWLGPDATFDAAYLFAFLDAVAALCPAPKTYGLKNDFRQLDQFLRNADPRAWEMLGELHRCAIFRRIWVVQELNLAADGYLLAGGGEGSSNHVHELSLFHFKTAMFWIRKRHPLDVVRRFRIPWENLDPFLYLRFLAGDISRPPASITGSSAAQSAFFVLRSTRSCTSTSPHDMIYGLLGHSSLEAWPAAAAAAAAAAGHARTRVPVDYTLPHAELYLAVARRLLEEPHQPLFTLSLVEHDDDDQDAWHADPEPECPSWVPRWDARRRSNYILADEFRDRYEKKKKTRHPPRPGSFRVVGRVLEVSGCAVDTVVWRSETMTRERFRAGLPGFPGRAADNVIRRSWCYLRETVRLPDASDEEEEEEEEEYHRLFVAFCLTLNAGCRVLSGQTYRDDVTTEQRLADCAAVLAELQEPVPVRRRQGRRPDTVAEEEEKEEAGDWDRFLVTTQDVCQDRCLIRTAAGRLGLAPRVASVGDEVCVLFGAQVPFLLSPASSSSPPGAYRLCGECYVHGIMNGEVTEGREEKLFRII